MTSVLPPAATLASSWLRSRLVALASCAVAVLAPALAQDGANDPGFNPLDAGVFGDGPDHPAMRIVVQPDGMAICIGGFSTFNGSARAGLARVDSNGGLDSSFDPGTGADGELYALVLQPDGKPIVAGQFTAFAGAPARGVARLLQNGAHDPSFTAGLGAINTISALALQADGRVLVGGAFYQGATVTYTVRRLLPNGALDASFDAGAGAELGGWVRAIVQQPDGRLLVAGDFVSFGGVARPRIARLNADGSIDASFQPGAGPNGVVLRLNLQPDGRILLSGHFTAVAGAGRRYAARLNSDGSLDPSFDPGVGANGWVHSSLLQPDGKLLICGAFYQVAGQSAQRLARLHSDGRVDTTFDTSSCANDDIRELALQADGKILLSGEFTQVAGLHRRRLSRVGASGLVDASYNGRPGADAQVSALLVQPDGKAIVAGAFTTFNGAPRRGIVRVDRDGGVDPSFDPGTGVVPSVRAIAQQPDGRTLIVGPIWEYDGAPANSVVRIHPDGSRDGTFDAGSGAYPGQALSIALQADGRIVVGGAFSTFNGQPRAGVARLLANGSVDPSFTTGVGTYGVGSVVLQPDGRILIGGSFTSYGGVLRNKIARLNSDGSLDPTFDPGAAWNAGPDGSVNALVLQPDGRVLIGGTFTSYSTVARPRIARVNPNGSLDTTFDPGSGVTGPSWTPHLMALALQPDGKVLIGGVFTHVGGLPRRNVARLNADGSADSTFDPGGGANERIWALTLDPHGRLWAGGEFTALRDVSRGRLGRLFAHDAPPVSYCSTGTSSNGCMPVMGAVGVPSVSASSGFTLAASGVEGQRQGQLLYGVSGRLAAPWATGGTSLLCIDAPRQRMSVANSGGSAGQCNGALSEDWRAWIAARPTALGQPLFAGQLVEAQGWYRDPLAPRGSNLTNGLEFLLRP